MNRSLFTRIVRDLSANCPYFQEGCDAVGKAGISALVKCTSAIRQLAYVSYMVRSICEGLRKLEKLYAFHEKKHGFPGMIGSINRTKWSWAQCPIARRAQFSRGDSGSESLILLKERLPPKIYGSGMPSLGYYLTDGIYPEWAVLMKSIAQPGSNDVKRISYKQAHEATRKDVERAFGVLKKNWAIIRTPARSRSLKKITHWMYTCIILHNMIHKFKGKAISPDFYPDEQHREDDPVRSAQDRLRVI
ncbi:putative nuclease HARBI1 isoform X2 [Tanacetum coccineum]